MTIESSAIQFPCDFTIKVMGKSQPTFEETVLSIIRKHFPAIQKNNIQKKPSKDNNYLSLSITVHAESKVQLDDCYRELSGNKEVLMVL